MLRNRCCGYGNRVWQRVAACGSCNYQRRGPHAERVHEAGMQELRGHVLRVAARGSCTYRHRSPRGRRRRRGGGARLSGRCHAAGARRPRPRSAGAGTARGRVACGSAWPRVAAALTGVVVRAVESDDVAAARVEAAGALLRARAGRVHEARVQELRGGVLHVAARGHVWQLHLPAS
ncbi:unnamed protein product [Parnassius apollo]|uniref:(apollo) hypothetical protein n=1 Tax=Parnassius apollo TaxID=110799 RepID=A0A8S3WCY4_PARAO|nr:unnamed protein product [Parnassius apollo]